MASIKWILVEETNRLAKDDSDRYDFEEELGRGFFGTVFKARDSKSGGKLVAIKLVGAKKNLWARILKRKERSSQLWMSHKRRTYSFKYSMRTWWFLNASISFRESPGWRDW